MHNFVQSKKSDTIINKCTIYKFGTYGKALKFKKDKAFFHCP